VPLAVNIIVALVAGYLIGGIPWALIIGKRFFGIDPREYGSGNLGATNVFRTLGVKAALGTLLLDALKGSVAVVVAFAIVPGPTSDVANQWTAVSAIMAAVLGHAFSPYIRFQGGKGVATSAGGLMVLTPIAALIELTLFVAVVASSRMVSLGSITIAVAYPVLVLWLYGDSVPYVVTSFVLAALVLVLHRGNIVRIARGQEPKVSWSGHAASVGRRKEGDRP
jgi:glycerol-3-phosphate acyltransferase PlsY